MAARMIRARPRWAAEANVWASPVSLASGKAVMATPDMARERTKDSPIHNAAGPVGSTAVQSAKYPTK